jgi:hypothetical protein
VLTSLKSLISNAVNQGKKDVCLKKIYRE